MAKSPSFIASEGEDFTIEQVSRAGKATRTVALKVDGKTGATTLAAAALGAAGVLNVPATGALTLMGALAGAPSAKSGAGAIDVTNLVTLFTSTGAGQALTIANGTVAGQLKIIHHTVDGGSGVLTPASAGNFATFTFTAVHDACLLQWSGTAWNILLNVGGTVA